MSVKIPINNWQLQDSKENLFDFYKWQQDKWVLLIFFRGKWCGLCRKQLMKINENLADFEKLNVKILAISGDDQMGAAILSSFLKLKFPVLPDEKFEIVKLFGVKTEIDKGKKVILPTLFLINPDHEIIWAYKGEKYDDVLGIDKIFSKIKKHL